MNVQHDRYLYIHPIDTPAVNNRVVTLLLIILLFTIHVHSQQQIWVSGTIVDENLAPLAGAQVRNIESGNTVLSKTNGTFTLEVPANREVSVEVSFIGYQKDTLTLAPEPGPHAHLEVVLKPAPAIINDVVVRSWRDRAEAMHRVNLTSIQHIPLPSGSMESMLSTLGASSRNELSAQYTVRGGNYDENLIYVNDIEIYRPLTMKSGQQEGLGFINTAMVSSVHFSAGGFDARFGDKMSSVLDIRYKRPTQYAASIIAGLLGASAHIEGTAFQKKLTHITGIRYKSNQYLLNTLQTRGDYKPRFFDLQSYITYQVSPAFEISFLGNVAQNHYLVEPRTRQTAFGTFQQTLNFTMYYEGQEKDRFSTLLGALSAQYHPNDQLTLKLSGSAFQTHEAVTYDILGQYWIDVLDNTPGSETAGDSILNIGVGGNLEHARNYLDGRIVQISHRGTYRWSRSVLNWGINWQKETFDHRIREWEMIDSAGYSLPRSDEALILYRSVSSRNSLAAMRTTGYLHNLSTFAFSLGEVFLNTGIRFHYLTSNHQWLVSPRIILQFVPYWHRQVAFHAAVGAYHQPPLFKEMVDHEGALHKDIRAQESIHFLAGSTVDYRMWNRPFRFTAEAYYKKLQYLIPYVLEDVDIQYLPQYQAKGYSAGIEFKINGEFVKDAESWATLSFLKTAEDRVGDGYGSYPRPSDQRVNFGLYFQDYFPQNPTFRVHLNLFYSSRLPYNATEYDNPQDYYYMKAYRRIDIGISKSLLHNKNGERLIKGRYFKDLLISAEVFNLFGFRNMASYQWVRTVSNQEGLPNMFAIPNYLTGRLLNFRLTARF
jgi:hypothetical protein